MSAYGTLTTFFTHSTKHAPNIVLIVYRTLLRIFISWLYTCSSFQLYPVIWNTFITVVRNINKTKNTNTNNNNSPVLKQSAEIVIFSSPCLTDYEKIKQTIKHCPENVSTRDISRQIAYYDDNEHFLILLWIRVVWLTAVILRNMSINQIINLSIRS